MNISLSDRMELCERMIDTSEQETKRDLAVRYASYDNTGRERTMLGFFVRFRAQHAFDQLAVLFNRKTTRRHFD